MPRTEKVPREFAAKANDLSLRITFRGRITLIPAMTVQASPLYVQKHSEGNDHREGNLIGVRVTAMLRRHRFSVAEIYSYSIGCSTLSGSSEISGLISTSEALR